METLSFHFPSAIASLKVTEVPQQVAKSAFDVPFIKDQVTASLRPTFKILLSILRNPLSSPFYAPFCS